MSDPASIAEVIAEEGGTVTFARFMELALTHPTLGYYCRAERILDRGGDFNTAPGLSPFFDRTLARLVTELLDAVVAGEAEVQGAGLRPSVVELGGGEGQLAAAILGLWEAERPELKGRVAYRTVEVGQGLQRRQEAALTALLSAGWDVGWGLTLQEACAGTRPVVVVGNEFLDTLPVHLLRSVEGEVFEAYVKAGPAGLQQAWGPVSQQAARELESLFGTLDPERLDALTEDGTIEVFSRMGALLGSLAEEMPSGSLVSIDYGEWFPGIPHEGECWGLEGRALRRRTVRGYFKHQLTLDPLARPGRQDLTADVDFATLDLRGRQHGFETVLFTTLAAFLRAGGAEEELEGLEGGRLHEDTLEADRQATVLRNLRDDTDLGGAFKVMVQVRE